VKKRSVGAWSGLCVGVIMTVVGVCPARAAAEVVASDDACAVERKVSVADRAAAALRRAGWPDPVVVMAISALPIVELRGGIPAGHTLMMPRDAGWETRLRVSARIFWMAVVGNMLPVPFILWGLGPLADFCSRWRPAKKFFDWLFARARRKSAEVEKYETLGLAVFVAIPLPATGAWTGAMVAFVLGMSFRHAFVSILAGVLIAGVIMTALSLMGWLGAALAGAVLLAMAAAGILKWLNREARENSTTATAETRKGP
jgi:uncharacterized membrane protein